MFKTVNGPMNLSGNITILLKPIDTHSRQKYIDVYYRYSPNPSLYLFIANIFFTFRKVRTLIILIYLIVCLSLLWAGLWVLRRMSVSKEKDLSVWFMNQFVTWMCLICTSLWLFRLKMLIWIKDLWNFTLLALKVVDLQSKMLF